MPWDDAKLLVIPRRIASQLQDLCSQVLHDCCHVHWGTSSNPLGIVTLPTHKDIKTKHQCKEEKTKPEQSVDPSHWKLKSCPAGTGLGLSLDLAAFTTSRHAS